MIPRCVVVFFLVVVAFAQTAPQVVPPESKKSGTSALEIPDIKFSTTRPAKFPTYSPSYTENTNDTLSSTRNPEVDTEREVKTLPTTIRPTRKHFNSSRYFKTLITTKSTATAAEVTDVPIGEIKKESLDEINSSALIEATKELEEEHSRPDDPKVDFLHFVQSALRSPPKKQQVQLNNAEMAPVLIKKLINIKLRPKNRPTIENNSSELPSRKEILKISDPGYNNDDFIRQTENNKYTYHNSKVQGVLNRNIDQVQDAPFPSFPHQIKSRRRMSYLPKRMRPLQNTHMEGLNKQQDKKDYNFEFSGEPGIFDSNPQGVEEQSQVNFPRSQHYTAVKQRVATFQKQIRPYKNYHAQENQKEYGDEQHSYESLYQQEFKTSSNRNTAPIQVLPSVPRRKMTEGEYDPIESKTQAENARYSFASDIEDNINGNLHQRQETREGTKVTGSYTYEDGFFRRTVHYVADEKGYRVVKEEVAEIGDGPSYNPEGSAKFHAYIAGNNVNYQITNKDISRMPQIRYQQPEQNFQSGYGWNY